MYEISIDTVVITPFNDEVTVECSYKDFAFYCIKTFETAKPLDDELMKDFMESTKITPNNKKNFSPEEIQAVFSQMLERKKKEFMKNKDFI